MKNSIPIYNENHAFSQKIIHLLLRFAESEIICGGLGGQMWHAKFQNPTSNQERKKMKVSARVDGAPRFPSAHALIG